MIIIFLETLKSLVYKKYKAHVQEVFVELVIDFRITITQLITMFLVIAHVFHMTSLDISATYIHFLTLYLVHLFILKMSEPLKKKKQ